MIIYALAPRMIVIMIGLITQSEVTIIPTLYYTCYINRLLSLAASRLISASHHTCWTLNEQREEIPRMIDMYRSLLEGVVAHTHCSSHILHQAPSTFFIPSTAYPVSHSDVFPAFEIKLEIHHFYLSISPTSVGISILQGSVQGGNIQAHALVLDKSPHRSSNLNQHQHCTSFQPRALT